MSIKKKFIKKFGEEQTKAIENAANQHYLEGGTISGQNKGAKPFLWVISTVIDLECVSIESNREYHGITISYRKFLKFCFRNRKKIGKHDGDIGWFGTFLGKYDFLISKEKYKKVRKTVLSRKEHRERSKKSLRKIREQMEKMRECLNCGTLGTENNQTICEQCGDELESTIARS